MATAKSLVSAFVGIDAVAGPTEIGIIADESAWRRTTCWPPTSSARPSTMAHRFRAVHRLHRDCRQRAGEPQVPRAAPCRARAERVRTSLSGTQSAIVLTDGLDQSVRRPGNAPNTPQFKTKDADAVVKRIKNAGAIFVAYSPVPLGDYMSGSNHVRTGGTARFAAGLGVHTFMKPVEVIEYDEEGLKALAARINAFAVSEDLPAHGECGALRLVKVLRMSKAACASKEKEAGLR